MAVANLRRATLADAPAIAKLHVDVWRSAYRDLAPPKALQVLDIPKRQALWTTVIEKPAPKSHLVVAEQDEELIGFCYGGPTSLPIYAGRAEIKTLYVRQDRQGCGVGRRLLRETVRWLAHDGCERIGLAVVKGNNQAIGFYERLGARREAQFVDPGPIWRSENLLYVWDDVALLLT